MHIKARIATAVFFGSLMIGCGGGSESPTSTTETPPTDTGGSPPPSNPPTVPDPIPDLVVTMNNNAVNLDELDSVTISFTHEGAQGKLSVSVDFGDGAFSATLSSDHSVGESDGSLRFSIGELENDGQVTASVVFTDGEDRIQEFGLPVTLINTSAPDTIEGLKQIAQNVETFLTLAPESLLVSYASHLAVLINPDFGSEEQHQLIDAFNASIDHTLSAQILSDANAFEQLQSDYHAGTIRETALSEATVHLTERLQTFASPLSENVNQALQQANGLIPEVSLDTVRYSEQLDMLSLFVGDPALGQYEGDTWIFNGTYQFLDPIVFPFTQTCNAD